MSGCELIARERARQVEHEGFDAEHDSHHIGCELAWAAVCYAAPGQVVRGPSAMVNGTVVLTDPWPWDADWDKRPRDGNVLMPNCHLPRERRVQQLAKAGALIAAEIDRLLARG